MQNNFKKFKKLPLSISVVFLISSCLVFFFLHRQIDINNKTSEDSEIEWQAQASKKDETEILSESLKSSEAERAALDRHFIVVSDVVPLLNTIENLATLVKANAEVTTINISPDNRSLLIDIKAVGTFESIHKFLRLLENSPYEMEFVIMDLDQTAGDVTVSKVKTTVWSAVLKMRLLSFLK